MPIKVAAGGDGRQCLHWGAYLKIQLHCRVARNRMQGVLRSMAAPATGAARARCNQPPLQCGMGTSVRCWRLPMNSMTACLSVEGQHKANYAVSGLPETQLVI